MNDQINYVVQSIEDMNSSARELVRTALQPHEWDALTSEERQEFIDFARQIDEFPIATDLLDVPEEFEDRLEKRLREHFDQSL